MTQFKAKSSRIGRLVPFYLLIISAPQEIQAQTTSPTIPIDAGKIPEQIQQQNAPLIPTEEPPKLDPQKELNPQQINEVINFAISTTSTRYPWLTNPTDRLTFSPANFNPNSFESYFDSDIRFASKNPTIVKLTYGFFPKSEQFYWVLPNNQVVIETGGYQAGLIQQGNGTDFTFDSTIRFSRALTGNQVVTTLPENFLQITNNLDSAAFSTQTTVAQAVNPVGTPAIPVVINSGLNFNSPNVTVLSIGTGSTNNPQGGSSNFGNLVAQNTPQVIQGQATVNLQALFDNGAIAFAQDSIVSNSGLAALGLTFNNGVTTQSNLGGFSSLPGVKILQTDKFDNQDLLQILTNPNLNRGEKQFYYLNSLLWSDLGERTPEQTVVNSSTDSSWQRLYVSRPVNQTLVTYDPKEILATYNNRFVNIGASISYSFDKSRINWSQSLNGTIGMLLGSAFVVVDPQNLQSKVDEAKKLRDDRAKFTPLATVATSEQRQQINQRLNTTLFYSNLASALEQVSGNLTFASTIRSENSDIFQIRTGLYRRAVQFTGSQINPTVVGDTSISDIRTDFENFGPLTFLGTQIPQNQTGFQPNESFASEIVLTDPNGRQFVQRINSSDPAFATIPAGINRFVLAFDRFELQRTDTQSSKFFTYLGYISLPSIEAAWTGSIDNFNYGISSGIWANFAPNTAGNVPNNNLGTPERSLGAFANAILSWSFTDIERGEKDAVTAVTTTSPVIRLNWNSSVNSLNVSSASFSYTISRQASGLNFSLTPGIFFVDQGNRVRSISFAQGSLDVGGGLKFRGSLEYEDDLVWSLEATQLVDPSWTIGLFAKNFRDINQGIDSREFAPTYGFILKYQGVQSPTSIEAQFGASKDSVELRIRGNLRL